MTSIKAYTCYLHLTIPFKPSKAVMEPRHVGNKICHVLTSLPGDASRLSSPKYWNDSRPKNLSLWENYGTFYSADLHPSIMQVVGIPTSPLLWSRMIYRLAPPFQNCSHNIGIVSTRANIWWNKPPCTAFARYFQRLLPNNLHHIDTFIQSLAPVTKCLFGGDAESSLFLVDQS